MNIPQNLRYTKDHEWLRIEGNTAYIGITDFAQKELGDIVYIEVDTINQSIAKEKAFGTIEAVKTVSDLYMPVTGKVLEANNELENTPELINQEPYDKGWIIKLEIENSEELEHLLDSQAYKELINV